jgi:FKBP-type peptidyl-prolyl cis-trans isomerase 2
VGNIKRWETTVSDSDTPTAGDGDVVHVHYRGTLDDGSEFDSSQGREPLEFTLGSGQVIPGFEQAVLGMALGGQTTVRIEPQHAYGDLNPEAMITVPADAAPDGLELGSQVQFSNGAVGTVTEMTDQAVTIDANHPLAGQALTFELELVAIQG